MKIWEDLRAPAAALPLALGGAADDISDRVVGALTPRPPLRSTQAGAGPELQRLSGTGLDNEDPAGDPGVPPKKPRGPLVNILKHNPLNPGNAAVNGRGAGDDVDDDQATENGTTVKRFPSHRLRLGRDPRPRSGQARPPWRAAKKDRADQCSQSGGNGSAVNLVLRSSTDRAARRVAGAVQ